MSHESLRQSSVRPHTFYFHYWLVQQNPDPSQCTELFHFAQSYMSTVRKYIYKGLFSLSPSSVLPQSLH